eukprot:5809159-Amphidinium_carterae.1
MLPACAAVADCIGWAGPCLAGMSFNSKGQRPTPPVCICECFARKLRMQAQVVDWQNTAGKLRLTFPRNQILV